MHCSVNHPTVPNVWNNHLPFTPTLTRCGECKYGLDGEDECRIYSNMLMRIDFFPCFSVFVAAFGRVDNQSVPCQNLQPRHRFFFVTWDTFPRLELKWPLFWPEKALFWGVDLKKKWSLHGVLGFTKIGIYHTWTRLQIHGINYDMLDLNHQITSAFSAFSRLPPVPCRMRRTKEAQTIPPAMKPSNKNGCHKSSWFFLKGGMET